MTLGNRLETQRLCNELETVVGDQDLNLGYTGIGKNVSFSILGGKYAQAGKEFMAAIGEFQTSRNKDELAAAVDEFCKKMIERP